MDNFTGVCRGGPHDGKTVTYFQDVMPVKRPYVAWAPMWNMSTAEIAAVTIGNYQWAEGIWLWLARK